MQRRAILVGSALLPMVAQAQAFTPQNPECIAPAAPGGGFDLTCRLSTRMMNETGIVGPAIRTQNMPGGIGAVAINHINAQRRADPNVIVAISTGSWVNMAQGRFGRFAENDVRWIGAIGADYGVIAVRRDSRFTTLAELMAALRADPASVPMGAGGAVGSQDWHKAALVARAAGADPRRIRYVPFEGGGQAMAALLAGEQAALGAQRQREIGDELLGRGAGEGVVFRAVILDAKVNVAVSRRHSQFEEGGTRGVHGHIGRHLLSHQGEARGDARSDASLLGIGFQRVEQFAHALQRRWQAQMKGQRVQAQVFPRFAVKITMFQRGCLLPT
jgi:hypothetical protein